MNHVNFLKFLHDNWACTPAIRWVKRGKLTSAQAWKKCDHLGWMFWLVRRVGDPSASIIANLPNPNDAKPCVVFRKRVKYSQLKWPTSYESR